MKRPSVVSYIKSERVAGKSDQQITHELLDAGWQMDIIAHAMHGDPVKNRKLEPILDIRNQPIRKSYVRAAIGGGLLVAVLLALYI